MSALIAAVMRYSYIPVRVIYFFAQGIRASTQEEKITYHSYPKVALLCVTRLPPVVLDEQITVDKWYVASLLHSITLIRQYRLIGYALSLDGHAVAAVEYSNVCKTSLLSTHSL